MRTQVALTISSVCLLLCATFISVYNSYADHHVKAEARVWTATGKGHAKASVKAPDSLCFGFYSMTVQVTHGPNKHESGNFSGDINQSLSTKGTPSADNYAGAYISDHNTNSPHDSDSDSDTDYEN